MKALSIDSGLTVTGLCIWTDGVPTVTYFSPKGKTLGGKLRFIVDWFEKFHTEYGPFDRVAIELPGPRAPRNRTPSLFKHWATVGQNMTYWYQKCEDTRLIYTSGNPKERANVVCRKFSLPEDIQQDCKDALLVGLLAGFDHAKG